MEDYQRRAVLASFRVPGQPYLGDLWLVWGIGCNVKCPTAPTINFPGTGRDFRKEAKSTVVSI